MDTTDSLISFDADGVCNHCRMFDAEVAPRLRRVHTAQGEAALSALLEKIKTAGAHRDHDCVVGLSGGLDSTYTAYQAKRLGLRPLAVHFDSGWNSEVAVRNIERIVRSLELDLITVVADWNEMRDLQLAFFKASVPNCDIPQDHGIAAAVLQTARRHRIACVLSGGNLTTESVLPTAWGHSMADRRHMRALHRRFGSRPLRRLPTLGMLQRYLVYPKIHGIWMLRLLDYVPYNKGEAKAAMEQALGWQDYGGKHFESTFTRFFQAQYLPTKFGIDKRKAHYSSLILAGEMSRVDALRQLDAPPDDSDTAQREKEFVAKKLGLSVDDFDRILGSAPRAHADYPSSVALFRVWRMVGRVLGRMTPLEGRPRDQPRPARTGARFPR